MSVPGPQGQRAIGFVYILVAVVAWIVALATQPISEWGLFGVLIGAAVALLGISGVWVMLKGKGAVAQGNRSNRAQRTWAIVGLIAMTLVIASIVLGDAGMWTAVDTFSVAVWLSLGFSFLMQLIYAGRD